MANNFYNYDYYAKKMDRYEKLFYHELEEHSLYNAIQAGCYYEKLKTLRFKLNDAYHRGDLTIEERDKLRVRLAPILFECRDELEILRDTEYLMSE